ncbi:chorismate-binding protein [Shigella boydii]
MHPTPRSAVSRIRPRIGLLLSLEPFDRELFGGIVGWCDSEGNGERVVTIRCAKRRGNQVRLFAGAGLRLRRHRWVSGAKQASSFLPCHVLDCIKKRG